MRIGLVAAGANIATISLVALVYGILSGSPQVTGLSLSGVLAGIAVIGVGASPPPGPSTALQEISRLLLNTITSINEQLDLNDATVQVVMRDQPLIVLAKDDVETLEPGIGATSKTTYVAIPLSGVLEEVSRLPEINYLDLRNALTEILIDSLGVAKLADVDLSSGSKVKVTLAGVARDLLDLENYPLSPLTLLLLASLGRITGSVVRLVGKGRTPEGLYWVFEMVSR